MSTIRENELPQELSYEDAVEAAYAHELADVASKLTRQLPTLIECDKELAPYLYLNIRTRLRNAQPPLRCIYLDGRPRQDTQSQPWMLPQGMIATMLSQLGEAVRGAVEQRIVVLPHLDLLTTSQGSLTAETREVIPLLFENPELVWLGFKDPSFRLPRVIENLFPHRVSLLGISRTRLHQLITSRECRKFGRELNPWTLHRYVSGVNAVRLRKLLATLDGIDYPLDSHKAFVQLRHKLPSQLPANQQTPFAHLRQATLGAPWYIPTLNLDSDVAGYQGVKQTLRTQLLDVLALSEQPIDVERLAVLEELRPRGLIVTGPAGVGKKLLTQALAGSLAAALFETSAEALQWARASEGEEALRRIFAQARRSAPAVILIHTLDATGQPGWPLAHELALQIEALPREQLVLVVLTATSPAAIDPNLLRAGRFELHLSLDYPSASDRRDIFRLYDRHFNLSLSEEALETAVAKTEHTPEQGQTNWTARQIEALCRSLARRRLLANHSGQTTVDELVAALGVG